MSAVDYLKVPDAQGRNSLSASKKSRNSQDVKKRSVSEQGSVNNNSEQSSKNNNSEHGSKNNNSEHGSKNVNSEHGSRNNNSEQGSRNINSEQGSKNINSEQGSRNNNSEQGSRNNISEKEKSKSGIIDNNSRNSNHRSNRKVSPSENEANNQAIVPDCKCGPDLYSRILGPTADEAILFGLQAVLELCNKLKVCDNQEEETEPEESPEEDVISGPEPAEVEIEEENLPEEPEPSPAAESQTTVPNNDVKSQTSKPNQSMTSQTVSKPSKATPVQTFQYKVTSPSQTSNEGVNAVPIAAQTPVPKMFSKGLQIFPTMSSKVNQTSLEPEMLSQNMQTSFLESTPPSMYSKVLQTSNPSIKEGQVQTSRIGGSLVSMPMQTSAPSLQSGAFQTSLQDVKSGANQTSRQELQPGEVQTEAPRVPPPIPPRPRIVKNRSSITVPQEEPTLSLKNQSTATLPKELSIPEVIPEEPASTATPSSKVESAPVPLKKSASARTQSDTVDKLNRSTSNPTVAETDDKSEETDKTEKRDSIAQGSQPDEHSCISPPEPPTSCQCCSCTASSTKGVLKKKPSKQETNPNQHEGCICRGGKPRLKCKCASRLRRGSCESNVSSSTSKLGKGDTKRDCCPIEVRYAITKISKYDEFTTYEIMKPTKSVPRKMPKSIDGVFVLRKKQDQ